jgi:hypothetical protein
MLQNNQLILENIEKLGQRYVDGLSYYSAREQSLSTNWWEALDFFFFHSFMRGRRDTLSNEYCYFALDALEDYLSIKNGDVDKSYNKLIRNRNLLSSSILSDFKTKHELGNKNSIKARGFEKEVSENNPFVNLLTTRRIVKNIEWEQDPPYDKTLSLGNDKDIMMVLDTLGFIAKDGRKNIYTYLKSQIANSALSKAYKELTEISNIGDKIATFTLRDIGLMNPSLVQSLKPSEIEYVFPVDTWVVTIAKKIGYKGKEDETLIKKYLIEQCLAYKLNPLKVASGTWYLGFKSLDLLLEAMGRTII